MPLYKVCVNRTRVDTYIVEAEDKDKAFNRVRQGKVYVVNSTKLNGDDIAVIEIKDKTDLQKWFDKDNEDNVYFELTDDVWVANIYKEEMDKDHAEKWGKNENHYR
tara:strand:+ start:412 stop:729 length:318 start_codon:yes stop_codon:yes gene_type:complete